MNQTRLRLSVVPRYPASVSATNGFKAVRINADVVITPDYGQLQMFSDVEDPLNAYFMAWIQTTGEYRGISFSSFVGVIAKEIYGENLASIDALITGQNNGLYTTSKGHFATYNLSEYFRSISGALDASSLRSAIGAAATVQTIPAGGGVGQVLAKNGAGDFEVAWSDVSGTGVATSIEVDFLANANVNTPTPNLTSGGIFVVDGTQVLDGMRVLLTNQNAPNTSGVWVYDAALNRLSRPFDFATGAVISQPFFVAVTNGDTFSLASYKMGSPANATIDVTAMTWVDADTGSGVQPANSFAAGPYLPQYKKRPASIRNLHALDVPHYKNSINVSSFAQSIFVNLNNFGYASRYIQAADPWRNTSAMNAMINEHNVCIFDKAVYLTGQITAALNGKRLVFPAQGREGPARVFMDSANASFLDLSGSRDLTLEGDCSIEYLSRAAAGVKAIKGTSFSRFKADRIMSKNVDFLFNVGGDIRGCLIDTLEVENLATDTPVFITNTSAAMNGNTGALKTRINNVEGIPVAQTLSLNSNFNYYPFVYGEIITLAGAQTAARNVVLTVLQNATHGKEATFIHNGSGGFAWNIGPGIKSISAGQFAKVKFDGSIAAWVLTGFGTL